MSKKPSPLTLKENKKVIGSYDVSIIGGTYTGELELTFTVGKQFEEDTIEIYRKKTLKKKETNKIKNNCKYK